MLISKWNERRHVYEAHEVPKDWNVATYADMDETVNCVCCGKPILFGESYTSRRFHTPSGFGYAECKECYEKAFDEDFEAMMSEDKQAICDALTKTLQLTRQYSDLRELAYSKDREKVRAYFAGGMVEINVAMDSGSAMIRDILQAIK